MVELTASTAVMVASAAAAAPMVRPARRRRTLAGVLLVTAAALLVLCAPAFAVAPATRAPAMRGSGAKAAQPPRTLLQAAVQEADVPVKGEEMNDFEKFIDRWNTKGGLTIATFLAIFVGWAFEKALELGGVESLQAGIWTSAILFVVLLWWTSTYLFRVATKSTTYAQQLELYEREVMVKRLSELDDEEIAALCEEVGVTPAEIQASMGDKVKSLSQKDAVLQLFKNTKMPSADPRSVLENL